MLTEAEKAAAAAAAAEKAKNNPNPNPGEAGGEESEGEGENPGADGGEGTGPKTLEEASAMIKKLRGENAKHRTTNKTLRGQLEVHGGQLKKVNEALGITDDTETPEARLAGLQQNNEALQAEIGIMQLAQEHGVPADQNKYFRFLLAEKFEGLEEGEELSETDLQEVIAQIKTVSGGKRSSTGVGGKAPRDQGGGAGEVTVDQFSRMTMAERTEVYDKSPTLYDQLMVTARQKRLIK